MNLYYFFYLLSYSYSFEMDLPVYYKTTRWKVGDEMVFPLSNNITAISHIQYVNTDGTFLSGYVEPIPSISNSTGVLSVGIYRHPCETGVNCETTINANFLFSNKTLYQLTALRTGKYQIKIAEKIPTKIDGPKYSLKKFRKQGIISNTTNKNDLKPTVLKILVLYTKQAVEAANGENNILTQIIVSAGNFNLTLLNSGISAYVQYVAERIQEYDTYIEDADMGVTLNRLGNTINTDRRYIYGCHAVQLMTSQTMYCGIADYDFNGFTSGYSVTNLGCASGYHSFTHEIGHNIGLHHDESAYKGYGFNKGYCWDNPKSNNDCHRSVMSYGSCVTQTGRSNCQRVTMFSNGETFDMGMHVGIKGQYDNAQQFRNNIWNFMNQFIPHFSNNSPSPSETPTVEPTIEPTEQPTIEPTIYPSLLPSINPSIKPTQKPSKKPTIKPSLIPTKMPTQKPTKIPTKKPTTKPSFIPTDKPTNEPSLSFNPSLVNLTNIPTFSFQQNNPSIAPFQEPTIEPTYKPSVEPTGVPSFEPSIEPTMIPSYEPSHYPSLIPTIYPSQIPSIKPTKKPSYKPSFKPSKIPTGGPTINPSVVPSYEPTIEPSVSPSIEPTFQPTITPSYIPSVTPTLNPSFKISTVDPSATAGVSDNVIIISVSTIFSVFILSVICIGLFIFINKSKKIKQRRPTGDIMLNTVYQSGPEEEQFNNDFRERLQSISPFRFETKMSSVVPLEQENLSSDKIMRIVFQDINNLKKDKDKYDKTLIREPEILNEEFTYNDEENIPNFKNSMRYIISSHIDNRFYDETKE